MFEARSGNPSFIRSALSFAMIFFITVQCLPTAYAEVKTTRIEPTCTEPGQILTEDTEAYTVRTETIPAAGHSFGEWTPESAEYEKRVCAVCGAEETRVRESDEERLFQRLELTGSMDGISKKTRVTLGASFSASDMEKFNCYAITSMQGHSTLDRDKANYTVRFYDDAEGVNKHKLRFGDWNKEHKYILKADYHDVTQCRNLVGAQLWREIVKTRANVHPRIASLPTLGAVDGFPVSVWLNGDFLGLYTLCLHKDDDLFDMYDGERAAILVCNRNTEDEAVFRAPAFLDEEGLHDWELEFCGTEDEGWARDSFNSLIDFVMHSSDEAFKNRLGSYLDVDAAVDYLLFIYTLGLVNSGAKDLVLVSFGDVWIPSAYDMDEAFGLMPEEEGAYDPGAFLPRCEDGVWTSGTGSLLWDRLLQNFESEIHARYRELRGSVLSVENILSAVDSFFDAIPASLYLRDAERYPGRPAKDDMIDQIHSYVVLRLPLLDEVLGGEQT